MAAAAAVLMGLTNLFARSQLTGNLEGSPSLERLEEDQADTVAAEVTAGAEAQAIPEKVVEAQDSEEEAVEATELATVVEKDTEAVAEDIQEVAASEADTEVVPAAVVGTASAREATTAVALEAVEVGMEAAH